jgi:hypothetical protein
MYRDCSAFTGMHIEWTSLGDAKSLVNCTVWSQGNFVELQLADPESQIQRPFGLV